MSVSAGGSGYGNGWKWGAKRGRSKSPSWRKKSPSRQYVTKRQLTRLVPKIVNKNAEQKHIHHTFASVVADQNGAVYHISKLDDGVLQEERVGLGAMITGFDFGGYFNNDETNESVLCRFIVFRCNEALTATPAVSDVLNSVSVGTTRVSTCLYNIFNIPPKGANSGPAKFTVFYDKTFGMSDEGSSVTKIPFRVNIKLAKPLACMFTGIEDTDEGPGQWYLLYTSTNATTTVQMNGDARLYFTDV